jgi:hypothetical protein
LQIPCPIKSSNPYHPDIAIFLWLIPFISAFNFYLTYPNLIFNGYYLMRFSIDTAQGYLAWWAVRAFIFRLDRRWTYEAGGWKRLVVQIVASSFLGLFVIASTTELISWIVIGKPAVTKFYTFDLVIISIWFYVVSGIYIGLYYFNKLRFEEQRRAEELQSRSEGFFVKQGKQELRLDFHELTGFFVEGEYVAVCHQSGKRYYTERSLDSLEKTLPPDLFFRLNRQYIIHRQLIAGFKRAEYGKVIVLLRSNSFFSHEISVSRLKAAAFRAWFVPD